MALDRDGARAMLKDLRDIRDDELGHHNTLWAYREGRQAHPIPENGLPPEVVRFLTLSRVNMTKLVVNVLAQSLFVDGFREDEADTSLDSPGWETWVANRFQSRQGAVHRGVFTYGTSYVVVERSANSDLPVLLGRSPRRLTTIYGEAPWPLAALETTDNGKSPDGKDHHRFVVYDEANRWTFTDEELEDGGPAYVTDEPHGFEVVPVVRFVNVEDLDDEIVGEVEDLIPIQDQIDVTTFELEVAKHYQAFKQRYIIGWTAKSENERIKASASRLFTLDEDPNDVKIGEFAETNLDGYLKSREATLQHLAVISQTPPHNLLGQLVNLSAEALVAAESGHRRKVNERTTTLGESWEQVFELVNTLRGESVVPEAEVRWRDTEARSFAATIDALGKAATMLKVPVEVLWEQYPHITQAMLKRWKEAAASGDSLAELARILDGQASVFAE